MATIGKTIINSKTNQSYRFLQTTNSTGGSLLEIESVYGPFSKEPPMHMHPYQEEYFKILSGEVTVRLGKKLTILQQGDELYIPSNTYHGMWNATGKPAVVNWKVIPAMDTEYLFETVTGLANDNKTDAGGKPSLLQLALTANRFSTVFRAAKPPFILQKIIFYLLTPFAYCSGKKAVYEKYID